MSIRSLLTLLVLVGVCLSAPLMAQDVRSTVTGIVTDPSGAAIPGATVKAINTLNNQTKEAQTTAAGVFTIPFLDPGTYNIEVTATGFQTLKREAIALRVGDRLNLPLQLTVGQVTQEITVVGQQEVIETASADRGLVFDPVKTQQYPLNGRQTYMLMSLTPGVIFRQEQFGPSGFSGTRGWDVNARYMINGAREGGNLFLLNGAPISDTGGQWWVAPNVEAVQEFKVMTNTYDASYGRFRGGAVNTVTKSGGNAWHGDVFDYWRNSVMDANYYQNNASPNPDGTAKKKPMHNQHQFGGVVGGPVRKDKDFVFFSFEGWQEVSPFTPTSSTVPTDLRDGQHFSKYGYQIFDPATTHVCDTKTESCYVNGQYQQYIRSPFPNNQIPTARISPIGQKILSFYPAPNAPGQANGTSSNFVKNSSGRYYYEQPMARWDHVFSDKDKFYAYYNWQDGYEYRDSGGFGKPVAYGNVNNNRHEQTLILDHTHVFSPTMVLDVRASYARFVQVTPGYADFSVTPQDLGMTKLTQAPNTSISVAPHITVGGFTRLFGSGSAMYWNPYSNGTLEPTLSLTHGRHTIKAGFFYNLYVDGWIDTGNSNGTFDFSSGWTQNYRDRTLPGGWDGSSVATLLLGVPSSGSISYNDNYYMSKPTYAFFVQDDWKVTPKLTINAGLRYDIQVPMMERYNRRVANFDWNAPIPQAQAILDNWAKLKTAYDAKNPKYPYPAVPASLTGAWLHPGVNGQPARLYNTDYTNIGPRLGLAYRILPKTVLRAGAGVYYQQVGSEASSSGYSQTTNYINSLDGLTPTAGLTGPYSLVDPFPNGITPPLQAAYTGVGDGMSFQDRNVHTPRTYQYSFGFQHELPHSIVAEVSYAGNLQIHTSVGYAYQTLGLASQQQAINDPSYWSTQVTNPFYGILPVSVSRGQSSSISRSSLMAFDPIFTSVSNNQAIQNGRYRSDALQVKVEQKALNGSSAGTLTWVLSYTFSKLMQGDHWLNGSAEGQAGMPLYWEIDDMGKPNTFSFSGVYDLPFGKGKKFANTNVVARKLIGDWRFDWILSYVSGNPVGWPNLINYCGDWHASYGGGEQNQYRWFNNTKSCYAQYPSNSFRTLADRFSDIREPQKPQLNIAFEKTIGMTERFKMSLRGEAFNVTNTAILPGPNTSFTSANFGIISSQQNNFPRICQIAAKFYF